MDVIQYHDPQGQTMVARVPPDGTYDIRLGSQLIVEESQQAVFFRDGKALDTFGPGRHTLATQNVPILTRMLNHVITAVDFYRNRTLVPGYYVGGKTGTAQIWDPKARGGKGDWKNNIFNYSFVGFIGKTAPRLIIAVQVHEGTPTILEQGHIEIPVMSFELFRRIATDAITTLDLQPVPRPSTQAPAASAAPGPSTAPDPTSSPRVVDAALADAVSSESPAASP